jgi:hypothetical protein
MERKRALFASAIVAASVMTGAVAYAASSSLTTASRDNVGQLQPTGILPPTITVIVDPATGVASATPAPAVAVATDTVVTNSPRSEREHEEEGDD